jgi:hypothetical protein
VTVTWSSGYPRPFELQGDVESSAGGLFATRFSVSEPRYLLRERDLSAYLADGNAAYLLYTLEARLETGETFSGTIGEGYNGSPRFRFPDGRELRWSSFEACDDRYFEFDDRRWELDPARPGPTEYRRGSSMQLLSELLIGPVGFRVARGVGVGGRGTIRITSSKLLPAIRVR